MWSLLHFFCGGRKKMLANSLLLARQEEFKRTVDREFEQARNRLERALELFMACDQVKTKISLADEVMIYVSPLRLLVRLMDKQQTAGVVECFHQIEIRFRELYNPALDPAGKLLDYADSMACRIQSIKDDLVFSTRRTASS